MNIYVKQKNVKGVKRSSKCVEIYSFDPYYDSVLFLQWRYVN